ncbi:isoprenoid synthase domain-containing protein [Cladochytrium replicatum]|nr:isoprenoid synthase domain-containing protein [Cladochytrium replicatum]
MSVASALLASALHPSELHALIKYKLTEKPVDPSTQHKSKSTVRPAGTKGHAWDMCYFYLNKTSRSFARVIAELDEELRHPVCIFYLVLRGLDTVEDDLTISLERKLPVLREFHKTIYNRGWTFNENSREEKDRMLLVEFHYIIEEFLSLKERYQLVIADICKQMGSGMADFCAGKKVITLADYNLYTHYVAGLVGIGLNNLFVASGLESTAKLSSLTYPNNMGLFLQKINILKDYLEDLLDGRRFWPEEVWRKYVPEPSVPGAKIASATAYENDKAKGGKHSFEALIKYEGPTGDLADFAKEGFRMQGVACLNELCADALELIPDCLEFMSRLENDSVFQFCAIPQLMAIASLTLFFNNSDLFTTTGVKIRRGHTVKLILRSRGGMESLKHVYYDHIMEISRKNRFRPGPPNPYDNSFHKISAAIGKVCHMLILAEYLKHGFCYRS